MARAKARSGSTARRRIERTPVLPDTPLAHVEVPDRAFAERQVARTIDVLAKAIRKRFGTDAVSRASDLDTSLVGVFPTGVRAVDAALGIGGFPLAKLVQISGPEAVGKSTFCKKLIAQALRYGITPYFIDGEDSQDQPERYRALDISPENVLWSDALTLEQAFGYAQEAIQAARSIQSPAIVFMDSIASFMSEAELELDFDKEGRRAMKASFLSRNIRKLTKDLQGTQIGMVFVNQVREKQNPMPFEDPLYEPGGRALRHYCHLTLRMKRIGQIKAGGRGARATGITSTLQVKKSKLAPPFRTADVAIYFDGRVEDTDGGSGE